MALSSNPSYIISGFFAVCLSHTHTACGELSPSTERCERRASRASLALVDELTGATSSGSCPARTSMCWPWSTSSLGTLPAGTTEAQVDDQILVAEVEGEATPAPIRPRPEMAPFSIPLI